MELKTKQLTLKISDFEDIEKIKSYDQRNALHLNKWRGSFIPITDEEYHNRNKMWKKKYDEKIAFRFFIFGNENLEKIIGTCNFTHLHYGKFQACYLGYQLDANEEGKGLMFEALQEAIRFIFEDLKLHRIMAAYMPENKRSANLLKRLEFEIEGYAKNYLNINGKWEDHVLTALSYERWQETRMKEKDEG